MATKLKEAQVQAACRHPIGQIREAVSWVGHRPDDIHRWSGSTDHWRYNTQPEGSHIQENVEAIDAAGPPSTTRMAYVNHCSNERWVSTTSYKTIMLLNSESENRIWNRSDTCAIPSAEGKENLYIAGIKLGTMKCLLLQTTGDIQLPLSFCGLSKLVLWWPVFLSR